MLGLLQLNTNNVIFNQSKSSTGSQGKAKIAITHAVAAAWLWLHQYKQDTIIKAFEQTEISLCPSGKDDHKLHVRVWRDKCFKKDSSIHRFRLVNVWS